MANNPQWKSFQLQGSLLNSDSTSSIFDFKSLQQPSLQGNFRSITGIGAGNSNSSGHGPLGNSLLNSSASGGLLSGGGAGLGNAGGPNGLLNSGGAGGYNSSSFNGMNSSNQLSGMGLFSQKNDLHSNMFSSNSLFNQPATGTPPHMNYNMFNSNNSSSSSVNMASRFPPIGTFSSSSNGPSGINNGGALSSTSMNNGLSGGGGPLSTPLSPPMNNGIGPGGDAFSNMFNGFGDMNSSSALGSGNANSSSSSYNDSNNQGTRETGIIEKLLHSYGFIQCCERQARLFFHFSQFSGNIEHLKIGDPVEFEMTYDRRTGKPIASTVSKIAPEVVLSEERVTGTVTTEIRAEGATTGDTQGRISYENRGECFFLPYTKDDVEGNVTLRTGDKVSFQIATNPRGNLGASHVRLENPVHPVKYQGVVCSMKESFGFIERADVVKEIFFHFSESKTSEDLLQLGDDVEFNIQTRNGKEVAVNLTLLPRGSVVFEDVTQDIVKGQVLKPLERGVPRHPNTDPLPGRIRYRAPDHSEVEIPFGEKDQSGDFTLRHGDWVQFQIATDRRDQLQRATKISLLHESFHVSGERREQGVIVMLKHNEGVGSIRSSERDPRVLFNFGEVLDKHEREICLNDEVAFTCVQDNLSSFSTTTRGQHSAIRIVRIPPGTVQFECITERNVLGFVTKEASYPWNSRTSTNPNSSPPGMGRSSESGVIAYNNVDGAFTKSIMYFTKDCCDPKNMPSLGDKVEFSVCQVKSNKQYVAVEIRKYEPLPAATVAITPNNGSFAAASSQQTPASASQYLSQQQTTPLISSSPPNNTGAVMNGRTNGGASLTNSSSASGLSSSNVATASSSTSNHLNGTSGGAAYGTLAQGFVAALKDGFGFIETDKHDREVFFHFSNFEGDANSLELGLEVEYTVGTRNSSGGSCLSAENVRPLSKGSIPNQAQLLNDVVYEGIVMRPLRAVNPDQAQYSGLVKDGTPDDDGKEFEFGIMSLVNKRDLLQIGDPVQFQVDSTNRAANIIAVRQKLKSTVNAIKGLFGFLNYEVEEGKKLFFHTSEVKDGANLQPGDQVEFVLVTNHRTGKSSACNVVKIYDNQVRPERLISRLRTTSLEEGGPKMIVTRQPKGPDGSRGFKSPRNKSVPGLIF